MFYLKKDKENKWNIKRQFRDNIKNKIIYTYVIYLCS